MRIVSTLLPAQPDDLVDGRLAVLMALDTLVGDVSLVVGIAVGALNGTKLADVRLSEVGTAVFARCTAHHTSNYPDGPLVLAGVAQVAGAKERVRKVLAKAPPGALVFLVCANGQVYDAAFPALNVNFESMRQNPQ